MRPDRATKPAADPAARELRRAYRRLFGDTANRDTRLVLADMADRACITRSTLVVTNDGAVDPVATAHHEGARRHMLATLEAAGLLTPETAPFLARKAAVVDEGGESPDEDD